MNSINIHKDFFEEIRLLDDSEKLELLTSLMDGCTPENKSVAILYRMIAAQNKRFLEKQSENGKKGGRPKNPTPELETQETQPNPKNPTPELETQESLHNHIHIHNQYNNNDNNNACACEENSNPPNPNAVREAAWHYESAIGTLSSTAMYDLQDFITQGMEPDVVKLAIDAAIDANARNWHYVKEILKNCLQNGILTEKQWVVKEAERISRKAVKGAGTARGQPQNRDYSDPSRYSDEGDTDLETILAIAEGGKS